MDELVYVIAKKKLMHQLYYCFFFFNKNNVYNFQLLDSGAQPNLEMERPYVDLNGEFSRPRPREYNIPEKSIMELFNPTVPHHQRPRS